MRPLFSIIFCIMLFVPAISIARQPSTKWVIDFRYGSEVLYGAYNDNGKTLAKIKLLTEQSQQRISNGVGHLQIVSLIPECEKGNMAAINFASIRGEVVRKWLKDNYKWLSDTDFAFYIQPVGTRNAIEVSYVNGAVENSQSDIFFSLHKNSLEKVDSAVNRYKRIPFLDDSEIFEKTDIDFNITNPALDPTITTKIEGEVDEKIVATIYYRWDNDKLDETYLSNAKTLHGIDSLLRLKSANYIDYLSIVAYASPEGNPDYNKRLSERRAITLKNYLLSVYPKLRSEQIVTKACGENWEGFRKMAEADPKLPMKEQVLSIINDRNISSRQRQSEIEKLDVGQLYKNYIQPNYYRYLRCGASLFMIYNEGMPVDIDFEPIDVVIEEPKPIVVSVKEPEPVYKYPIAFKTNLLYDAVGAINVGIEIPMGKMKNWSWIIDGAYAYWHTKNNLYAMQTLEYGTELRYWPGANKKKQKNKSRNWGKPLKGWNLGVYGRYWERYDMQWTDGVQGDDTWSVGLTAGYAFPISKRFSFEASVGVGYLSISEYRHYHQPEYDNNGKHHLMWQQTGSWSGLSITKVRFSLVWLIEYKQKKGGRK